MLKHDLYEPYEYLVVKMKADFVAGSNYTLATEFRGELANDLRGLYRSTYTNADGVDV